jgi:hypothetical protein
VYPAGPSQRPNRTPRVLGRLPERTKRGH